MYIASITFKTIVNEMKYISERYRFDSPLPKATCITFCFHIAPKFIVDINIGND